MKTYPLNPLVDHYLEHLNKWKEETALLRKIILGCGLTEEFKWGKPCYAFQGKNILIIQGFKGYFALLFFKGYLLTDTENILVKMGENTKTGRQIRFKNVDEITKLSNVLKDYIKEAVKVEQED